MSFQLVFTFVSYFQFYIDYENGNVYRRLIQLALDQQEKVDFVQLVTWNDFGEGKLTVVYQSFRRKSNPAAPTGILVKIHDIKKP